MSLPKIIVNFVNWLSYVILILAVWNFFRHTVLMMKDKWKLVCVLSNDAISTDLLNHFSGHYSTYISNILHRSLCIACAASIASLFYCLKALYMAYKSVIIIIIIILKD